MDKNVFNEILKSYSIKATCEDIQVKNNYYIFYITLLNGCKISSLESLSREIQLALKLETVPIFIPDYKSGRLQMICSKKNEDKLLLKTIFKYKPKSCSDCQIGIDALGNVVTVDLTEMPHMLVAGTTGSGKSVFLNVLIANIFAMKESALLFLVDPKKVEFEKYNLLRGTNVFNLSNTLIETMRMLNKIEEIMDARYDWMSLNGYRNVKELWEGAFRNIFVIIDEFGDLVSQDKTGEFTKILCKLAAKSRAAGIHFIIATQRASVNVVNGLIKANFPVRVVFKVASSVESRIMIDINGAENLASKGDGILFGYKDEQLKRFKCAFVDFDDVVVYTKPLQAVV